MSDKNLKILVGKIVAPQGIRGDVRVQTYTEHPDDFCKLSVFSDKFSATEFKFIRKLNPTSNVIVAHVSGIDNRNAAEIMRGTELFVSRNTLPATKKGEYYQTDLIGFAVIRDGKKIGIVECFQNFGAGDIIELDTGDMVSFINADVDMDNNKIYINK